MTPQAFIDKWRAVELKERTAAQSHFNDLCTLLGLKDPITEDPKGETFTFEKGATKTGGGDGWADVWRKGCFAWEYKGKKKDLDKAFAQLQQYAIALENPPLLIVSDMERIRIHTNWTNTVQQVTEITLDDLIDGAKRDILRACFTDPEKLKPQKTRQLLTEEAAQRFATLAQRLRERGHEAHKVAHFVNRLVFCMFAEDVGLLPEKLFEKMLDASRADPAEFEPNSRILFEAMRSGGRIDFTKIEWFNGGLFDTDDTLPLEKQDVLDLIAASKLDWSDIDPSILGTLFERGLDPDKRSQLGAHYTDRDKIMQIVTPVIVAPLLAEWEGVKAQIAAQIAAAPKATKEKLLSPAEKAAATKALNAAEALHRGFLDRLKAFRVLDPACGSGNFLYLALIELKNIEHRVNLEAEALGLQRPALQGVGPENVLGIELNPYAAELARVSVWIGEIQWMRKNGFEAARNPILRTLSTIENRDAVLAPDGSRADWPKADVVVGNPPFLGDRKMKPELGADYTKRLRAAYKNVVPGGADLVCYWFAKAWAMIEGGQLKRAGFVSTNSIRGGLNREVLKPIVTGGMIYSAWADEEWTVDGAAVRVSLVAFSQEPSEATLDGKVVPRIFADLTGHGEATDLTAAIVLEANVGKAFQGTISYGPFEIDGIHARKLLVAPTNPNGTKNSDVVRPWTNGKDITTRHQDNWIIFFPADSAESEAALYELPFEHILGTVRPYRLGKDNPDLHRYWWRLWRSRPEMFSAIKGLTRQLVTPRVSKHRLFVWRPSSVVVDSAAVTIARDDDTTFGILHSRFHELWALRMGTFLGVGNDPRYTPSTTFETFPFPEGLTPNIPAADYAADPRAQAIAAAAANLDTLRENWLNPADLVQRVPEVLPGYPDLILPVSPEAEKELKKRTLTNLYNARPAWLENAHKALDAAVAAAYGWGDDWAAGKLTDDEILARLFALNQARAGK